jgi:hypothetical protein
MATRSTIAKLNPDGSLTSVYCHWDGYPDGVGATLRQHYTNPSKIDQLLALGDLSVLEKEIGDRNDFENPVKNVCLFYGRDRGETGIEALVHANVEEWLGFRRGACCEYGYLRVNGEWQTFKITGAN